MILHDISMTVAPGMPVYKGREEKRPRFTVKRSFTDASTHETRLDFDLHSGTHVDMPLHVFPGGADSDSFSPDLFFSPCCLLDFSALKSEYITADDLCSALPDLEGSGDRTLRGITVLLKTANSFCEGSEDNFVYLEKSGAAYLAGCSVGGVGIDALGIERDQPGHPTHKTLLEAGAFILEGLRLSVVSRGFYTLAVLPLKIAGVEALPARALLLDAAAGSICSGAGLAEKDGL